MDRMKKTLLILGVFIMVVALTGVSVAFFNYTRTGTANTISVGNISFTSSQNGNINLTNAFPIASSTIDNTPIDEDNIGVVSVDISGSTSYSGGIEYVVTVDNFNNTTLNNKKIPVSIATSVEGRNSKTLGTSTSAYFDENVRENSNVAIYRKTDYTNVFEDEQLLVGYIPKDIEVDGTLIIKAYLDKDVIAISDTYDGTESNNMGTTNTWINGRTYFTTEEWNNLQGTPISFNVKVEANEGIWVEEVATVNAMNTFPSVITDEKANIKEVYFNRMSSSEMQAAYDSATIKADLTYNNEGKVLAYLKTNTTDNTKYDLIVASDGDTYLATGYGLFAQYSMDKIEFNNINTSRVTNMSGMFVNCNNLENIDLINFDTSNVTNMGSMFSGCSALTSIDLSNMGNDNLTTVDALFGNCSNLREINMSNFNFGRTTSLTGPFNRNLTSLESINLTNAKMDNVTSMAGMFAGCSSLTSIDLSNLGSSNLSAVGSMFSGCTNLREINMSNFNFGTASLGGLFSYDNNFQNLQSVNLSNANTVNVTSMAGMFRGSSSIREINLSGIDTHNVTGMGSIFLNCSSLETIYVSNSWNTDNVPANNNLFDGCTSLVGMSPNGTTYAFTDYNVTDKTYAVIATDTTPGYLTDISLKPTN